MYLVVIAWLYVTVMMALAEATSSTGSILGAIFTFALYGLLPLSIVVYILGTPSRRRVIHAREMEERAQAIAAYAATAAMAQASATACTSTDSTAAPTAPDADGHAATAAEGHGIAPVRKEP